MLDINPKGNHNSEMINLDDKIDNNNNDKEEHDKEKNEEKKYNKINYKQIKIAQEAIKIGSNSKIAKKYNICEGTVRYYIKKLE